MKKKIMNWLGLADSQETAQTPSIEHAAAVLMVEIMRADDHWHDLEQDTIIELLGNTFAFSKEEAQALFNEARQSVEHANDLYYFTRVVNQHFSITQKEALIKNLWKVAYADNINPAY